MNTQYMNSKLIVFLLVIGLWSCNSSNKTQNVNSSNIEELRKALAIKQQTLKDLTTEIDQLSERILELDTVDKPRRLVTLDTVKTQEFNHYTDFQGTVQSEEVLRITSETGGRIIKLFIAEGQSVSRGQLIGKLDSETMSRQLEELETSLSLASTVYERQQKLWDQKIGSEIQLIEAKSNKERLEKSISTLKSQLAKANIFSPGNGIVEQLNVKEGEFLSPGMPMATVINIKKVKVVANIPESYIGMVSKGDKVTIKFPTLGTEIATRVNLIGKTISEGNRTFTVEAPINQVKEDWYKPNLLARMRINDFTTKNAIVLQAEQLQQESNGRHFVFVKGGNGDNPIAVKQYIEVDRIFEDKILVKNGLEAGDILIKEGARGLSNNELISF
jgi:membrane fusion protein (multidrug efflux system)